MFNEQINNYLSMNNLLPAVQSAYRKQHSTETAVLKVLSDIYSAADAGQITLLGLLDLSSAFDTVDHQILFDRLQFSYGFEGAVLGWFRSYLTGRSQYIRYNGVQSVSAPVLYGVPQGSVLGPVLFILYSADVIDIATKHGFFAHSYADDLQIYDDSSQTTCLNLVPRMSACIEEISTWMASNRLKLNPSKTEIIWLGSSRRLKHCPMDALNIAGVSIKPSSYVRDLGVYVDGDLSLEAHISQLSRTCFYHLRQLRVVRRSLTTDSAHSLIRALVHSRVDYCNGVLAGPTTDSDQQASIHSPCSSSPCAAATRLGQCLESDACAAPLAFHSTEDSVQAVLGGVQVSSQHGADILTRSLRAYLVF